MRRGFRRKFIASTGLLAAVTLLLGACGALPGGTITITATPGPDDLRAAAVGTAPDYTLPPDAIGPFGFASSVNPLTGLPVVDPAVLERRPLAVKISNAPAVVRPQAGIGAADLVFEHYVEAGLTRFTAIFLTQTPPRVGSVRSARLIDLELPQMYGALFAYSGASNPIRALLAAAPFAPRSYEGVSTGEPLYFRDATIDAPHNLFVIPAQVWERAEADGVAEPAARLGGMVFSPTPPQPAQTQPAAVITIDYGPDTVTWEYDARAGLYHRAVNGEPHRDANTSTSIRAANVILITASHADNLDIIESEWQGVTYYSITIDLLGHGPAVICRDGRRIAGYWQRAAPGAMLGFSADAAGAHPIALKPGSTWFQVLPEDFSGAVVGE